MVPEHRLEASSCRFDIGRHERISIEHNRQARMVRDPFMGFQPQDFDFRWVSLMADVAMRSLSSGDPRFQLEATGAFGSGCDFAPASGSRW
jgi:hypothetical protein